jgi:hypothetical protein
MDPDNLWDHAQKQTLKIAEKKYGPAFMPRLIHSCNTAQDAAAILLGFLENPDSWYRKYKIPSENVEKARIKTVRIRQTALGPVAVETFERPNFRLSS